MKTRIAMKLLLALGLLTLPAMAVVDSAQTFGLWHMESLDPVVCPTYNDARTGVLDDDTVYLFRNNDLVMGQQRNPEELSQRPTITTNGFVGNALEFDGIDDMARSSFVWPNTQDCEFEFDLYAEAQAADGKIIYITSSMFLIIRTEGDGTRTLILRVLEGGVPVGLAQSVKFNSTTWVHVLARIAGGEMTIEVDGAPGHVDDTYTTIDPVHSSLNKVWIGADQYAGGPFKGRIDELAIRDLNQQMPDYVMPYMDGAGTYVLLHCDETNATTAVKTPDDDSVVVGRNNDGLMIPASFPPDAYLGAPLTNSFGAAFDQCFVFNGSNQSIRVGDSATDDLGVPDNNVRVEAFARLDHAKANDNSLHTLFYQASRFAVVITDRSSGDWRLDFTIWTELGAKQLAMVIADPSVWHHYALEFSDNQLEGFVDGVSVGTLTGVGTGLDPAIRQLYIGGNHSSNRWWTGPIDEFRISTLKTFSSPYEAWLSLYPGVGSETNKTDNPDSDSLDNLGEWALGGNPDDDTDIGHVPTVGAVEDGGANWLEYVYAKRKNADALGLDYWLELKTDLVTGAWVSNDYTVGTGTLDAAFDAVTNRVPTDAEIQQFIQLMIESN